MRWPEIKKGGGQTAFTIHPPSFRFFDFQSVENGKRKLKGKTARLRRVNFQTNKSPSEAFKAILARFSFEIRQD